MDQLQINSLRIPALRSIQTSSQPINADSLKGVRILYLRAPSKEFTSAETEAIVAFVKGGGSLLLVLD